ncbi:TolC family protein [Hymenobacter sp. 15J16-1T3B]|uniref:TolC family protein n=1 Tax=Hymenobacter sp. 15J16-1T3B TaxID=2886941 RepID=UPI001D10D89B|nr:TolC family protein [Hymenobacter sp. 15J16-1T3B]MCC3159337.1 TolC family protein [Hymenobacter sp. 15J16-1T3B]
MFRAPFRLLSLAAGLLLTAAAARAEAPVQAAATDTVRLALPQAEQQFVDNNFALLAQRFNVSAAEAQILQARLWDNPTISVEQNAYNQFTRKTLDVTRTGNTAVQVQQLFAIAGRRKAAAAVAQQNTLVEQYNLQDLLRTLRYQLRTTFYDLYFKQRSLSVYDRQISEFRRTIGLYEQQLQKGNIALKDVVRLKAFLFDLETERQTLLRDMAQDQADLHVLLRDETPSYLVPQVSLAAIRALSLSQAPGETALADSAQNVRADVKARMAQVQQQQANLRLQHALAAPDLAVGYVYDRAGNYIQNYNAVTLGIAVPVFNRNQGNIRTARAQMEGSQAQLSQQQLQVRQEVYQAYALAQQAEQLSANTDRNTADFDKLIDGIERSYAQRNITIVEFLDFYESYKENLLQRNERSNNRIRAYEQLNYAVGRPVLTPAN